MAGRQPAVDVEGAREVSAGFRKLAKRAHDLPHEDAAEVAAAYAHAHVPVRDGLLDSTIRVERTDDGADVLAGSRAVPYAAVHDFGWPRRNIDAQPYLANAVDQYADAVVARYDDHVDAAVRRFELETPG